MVGPIGDEERQRTVWHVKAGFVLLVGLSAGLITTQGDVSLAGIVAAVGAGIGLGAGLVWLLFPDSEALSPASERRRRFGK